LAFDSMTRFGVAGLAPCVKKAKAGTASAKVTLIAMAVAKPKRGRISDLSFDILAVHRSSGSLPIEQSWCVQAPVVRAASSDGANTSPASADERN
jgi:hypothetical protein